MNGSDKLHEALPNELRDSFSKYLDPLVSCSKVTQMWINVATDKDIATANERLKGCIGKTITPEKYQRFMNYVHGYFNIVEDGQ